MRATRRRARVGTTILVSGFLLLILGFPARPSWGYLCTAMKPVINGVVPSSAPSGSMVAINLTYTGSFDCLDKVTFGGTESSIASWDGVATVVARVPSLSPGSAPIVVDFHVGGASNSAVFTVLSGSPPPPACTAALPVIEDVLPKYGAPQSWVKITVLYAGDLLCLEDVRFGGTSSPVETWDGVATVMAKVPQRRPGYAPIVVDFSSGGENAEPADFWLITGLPALGGWGLATLALLLLGAAAYAMWRRGWGLSVWTGSGR